MIKQFRNVIKELYSKKKYIKVRKPYDGKTIKNESVLDFYMNKEYYRNERIAILKYLKPYNYFVYKKFLKKYKIEIEDFNNLTFDTIKQLQDIYIEIDPIRVVVIILKELMVNKSLEQITEIILRSKIIDFFHFFNYIKKSLEKIEQMEKSYLTYEPSAEEIAADLTVFNQFGAYGIIRGINNNILEDEEYLKLPYSSIFSILIWSKTERGYQERLMNIQSQKHKK